MANQELEDYSKEFSSVQSDILSRLEAFTIQNHHGSNMLSGPLQGRFLAMISRMLKPKLIVEIGTYTGYSALCLAEGLPTDGRLITIDTDINLSSTHESFLLKSIHADQIVVKYGDAKVLIPAIEGIFDLVFIDGAKKDYLFIYEQCVMRMRSGGVLLIDNVLWKGKVLEEEKDSVTQAIHDFNHYVRKDQRVDHVLLPLRDGIMMVQVK